MLGNMNQMIQIMQAMRNPQQFLQRMGIPQESLNSPQDAAQYLMQSGRVTQQQVDQANNLYQQYFNSNAQR